MSACNHQKIQILLQGMKHCLKLTNGIYKLWRKDVIQVSSTFHMLFLLSFMFSGGKYLSTFIQYSTTNGNNVAYSLQLYLLCRCRLLMVNILLNYVMHDNVKLQIKIKLSWSWSKLINFTVTYKIIQMIPSFTSFTIKVIYMHE